MYSGIQMDRGLDAPGPTRKIIKLMAGMSMPRLGFTANFSCAYNALTQLHIPLHIHQGSVFWEKAATDLAEKAIADDCDYIVFVDYDSLFSAQQLSQLICAIDAEGFDALFPVQVKRGGNQLLVSPIGPHEPIDLNQRYSRALTGHFGLTVIRCAAIPQIPKPWFMSTPNTDGDWQEGPARGDADVNFWRMLNHVGGKVYQANWIRIGHMELVANWPTTTGMIRRSVDDFLANGVPPESLAEPHRLEQGGGAADFSPFTAPPASQEVPV